VGDSGGARLPNDQTGPAKCLVISLFQSCHYAINRAEPCSTAGPRLGAFFGPATQLLAKHRFASEMEQGLAGASPHQAPLTLLAPDSYSRTTIFPKALPDSISS